MCVCVCWSVCVCAHVHAHTHVCWVCMRACVCCVCVCVCMCARTLCVCVCLCVHPSPPPSEEQKGLVKVQSDCFNFCHLCKWRIVRPGASCLRNLLTFPAAGHCVNILSANWTDQIASMAFCIAIQSYKPSLFLQLRIKWLLPCY